jgi:single-stranded DNA-binding protein
MDLNLAVLLGRLATPPELRVFESGSRLLRFLITVKQDQPRRRIDVLPVTWWEEDTNTEAFTQVLDLNLQPGDRLWICGSYQRRFWDNTDGRRSRLELVAQEVEAQQTIIDTLNGSTR